MVTCSAINNAKLRSSDIIIYVALNCNATFCSCCVPSARRPRIKTPRRPRKRIRRMSPSPLFP